MWPRDRSGVRQHWGVPYLDDHPIDPMLRFLSTYLVV